MKNARPITWPLRGRCGNSLTLYLTDFRQSGVPAQLVVVKPVYNLIVTKTPFT